jgi:maleate isomerase
MTVTKTEFAERTESFSREKLPPLPQWLERHRRILVQNDFSQEPRPPQALIDAYSTAAQMLGPVILKGALAGWISVHENSGPRAWQDQDVAALQEAVDAVVRLVEDFERPAG